MLLQKIRLYSLVMISMIQVQSAHADLDLSLHRNNNNPSDFKYMVPRSAVMFSPRWANNILNPQEYLDQALRFNATNITWHYPRDAKSVEPFSDELIQLARTNAYGFSNFNCGLPSTTNIVASACIDANGIPVGVNGSTTTFHPNTDTASFRNEVKSFLANAKLANCNSFHQDNPQFMVVRQSAGCMTNINKDIVQQKVFNYYEWLHSEILRVYDGGTKPMSYNKKFADVGKDEADSSYNMLAPYFNSVTAEVEEERSNPKDMYYVIQQINQEALNLSTSTVLVSRNAYKHQRHIAMSYALLAPAVAPYDTFIAVGEDRFYGNAADYANYYSMIRKNKSYFDGFGTLKDIYIEKSNSGDQKFSKYGKIFQAKANERPNMMAVLRANGDRRVLHVVNTQGDKRFFTIYMDKSLFKTIPVSASVVTPEKTDPTLLAVVYEAEFNRVKVSVPTFNIWSVVNFN